MSKIKAQRCLTSLKIITIFGVVVIFLDSVALCFHSAFSQGQFMLLLLLRFVYFTEEDGSLSCLRQQNTATLHKTYGLLYLIFTLTGVYLKLLITLAQLSVSHPLWFNSLSTAIVILSKLNFEFFLSSYFLECFA